MPTIPKLVAAICLSITAYLASKMVMALLPPSTDFGIFVQLNMGIGFMTGWFYTGQLATTRIADALSYGLTGAAILTFLALFAQSAYEMTRLALRHRYDGPLEAVAAVFQIGVDFGADVFSTQVIITLAIGGLVSGVLTLWSSRHWQ